MPSLSPEWSLEFTLLPNAFLYDWIISKDLRDVLSCFWVYMEQKKERQTKEGKGDSSVDSDSPSWVSLQHLRLNTVKRELYATPPHPALHKLCFFARLPHVIKWHHITEFLKTKYALIPHFLLLPTYNPSASPARSTSLTPQIHPLWHPCPNPHLFQ